MFAKRKPYQAARGAPSASSTQRRSQPRSSARGANSRWKRSRAPASAPEPSSAQRAALRQEEVPAAQLVAQEALERLGHCGAILGCAHRAELVGGPVAEEPE